MEILKLTNYNGLVNLPRTLHRYGQLREEEALRGKVPDDRDRSGREEEAEREPREGEPSPAWVN